METIQMQQTVTRQTPKVIQFGEGNFMRGFIDWQLQQMNQQNLFNGSAVVVQPIQQGLGKMLAEQDYLYTVILEGLIDGQPTQTSEIITTVHHVLNPYEQWQEYLDLAKDEQLEVIVSNTTEAGIVFNPSDQLTEQPPQSFPAKLTALLYHRFQLNKKGFLIIPCELIDRNGEKLKEIVLQYAALWELESAFIDWLEDENTFCCSLVDRIVPGYPRDKADELNQKHGYQDNLMVTAEPFMLWVIEGPSSIAEQLPLQQAGLNVVITKDMTPYRERKVHLLNGPHTAMVPLALLAGLETVEEVMLDADFAIYVDELFSEELIPMLELPREELEAYAEQIKERFKNPFVHHQLRAILLNSVSKFTARLLPILQRYQATNQQAPKRITAALAALLHLYLTDAFQDEQVRPIFDHAKTLPQAQQVQYLLSQEALWGTDLSSLTNDVNQLIDQLRQDGARACVQSLANN